MSAFVPTFTLLTPNAPPSIHIRPLSSSSFLSTPCLSLFSSHTRPGISTIRASSSPVSNNTSEDSPPPPPPPPLYDPSVIQPLGHGQIGTQWFPYEWTLPGVYAIFNANQEMQYVALSRNCAGSIEKHMLTINDPELCAMARVLTVVPSEKEGPNNARPKQGYEAIAREWIEECVAQTGNPPEGNRKNSTVPWRSSRPPPTQDPNDPIRNKQNLTFPEECRDEAQATSNIENIISNHKVVLFMKGSRQAPQCGFSQNSASILMNLRYDFECIDCLDANNNPGLRDGIKKFSAWPTIPQLYINQEFIGGNDILQNMLESGELQTLLQESGAPKL